MKALSFLPLILSILATPIFAKDASEYTDRELRSAGWTQEQIDILKGRKVETKPNITFSPSNTQSSRSTDTKDHGLKYFNVGHSCSYFGESMPHRIVGFKSDQEAIDAIDRIVEVTGLPRNFEVVAGGVNNAAAGIRGSKRYIFYNQTFMRDVRRSTGNRWAGISIMAHEVGHHLAGHTLDDIGSRPDKELEADAYSGFIMQRLGASLDDAQAAMNLLGSETGSSTHPAKRDRLAAIANGYIRECERSGSCNNDDPPSRDTEQPRQTRRVDEEPPEPRRERQTRRSSNSCEYANDGECDEPDLCDLGTDTNDCKIIGRTERSRQEERTTRGRQICQTPTFWCQMNVPGMVGGPCFCNTPIGSGSGYIMQVH